MLQLSSNSSPRDYDTRIDEPTANLDAPTAREILQTVQSLMEGRTVLLVTHQSAGLDVMDAIVRLKDGRRVERSHRYKS